MIGPACAIVAAVFIAISLMQMRRLGKKVHFLIPPLYQAITNCFIAPVGMIVMLSFRNDGTTTYGHFEVLMLLALSICGFLAQIFQTKAL